MSARDDRVLPVAVAATLATLAVVFYYPVGSVLASAVSDAGRFTTAPLAAVLGDPFYHDLFAFTAYQALLSTVASVVVGLPGAYLLARFEFPGRRFLRSVTILPFVLPSIMVAVGFLAMFGRTGLVNDVLTVVGLGPVELTFTLEIIVLAHAFYNAPLVTRLVTAAWESVDPARVETARTLGATPLRAFRDVTLPQLLPALLTASVLTFIFTFMSFPIVLALGGLELATVEVWLFARVQRLDLAEAATLGAIETALSLGLIYVYLRFEAAQLNARGESRGRARTPLFAGWRSLVDPKRVALFAYAGAALVLFVGPLVSLVVESVTTPDGAVTLRYYEFLLAQQASTAAGTTRPLPAITNSLLFGVGALLLALPMGVVVSVVATRERRGSRLWEALLTAPWPSAASSSDSGCCVPSSSGRRCLATASPSPGRWPSSPPTPSRPTPSSRATSRRRWGASTTGSSTPPGRSGPTGPRRCSTSNCPSSSRRSSPARPSPSLSASASSTRRCCWPRGSTARRCRSRSNATPATARSARTSGRRRRWAPSCSR